MQKTLWTGMAVTCFTSLFCAQMATADTFQGISSGVFSNPDSGVNTGVNTSNFGTGTGTPTTLAFAGNDAINVDADSVFSFGTLTYFNGATTASTTASTVDLVVNLMLTSPTGIDQDFTYNLTFNMTSNVGSPQQQADYLYLPASQPSASFSFGGVDYTLEFLGFGSLDNNGFVTTVDQFHVYEYESSAAQLFGKFTESTAAVPEPATMLLFGTGVAGLAMVGRKKKN